jgi:hypothetical protein
MIDPIVQKILAGAIIYGIAMLYAAAAFQVYRREKKSALVLSLLATTVTLIVVAVRLTRHGAG